MATRSLITIGRQYGSGGCYVGKLLANELGIAYYDKEILTLAAKQSGISEALFEQQEKKPTQSMLFSLAAGYPMRNDMSGFYIDLPLNHRIFLAQFEAIKKVAEEGPCVIVGRCADYVLRDNPNAVRCFIYADDTSRCERLVAHYGVEADKAADTIQKADKQRANYYNYYASGKWGELKNYNLAIDTGCVGVQGAVELIKQFVALREAQEK